MARGSESSRIQYGLHRDPNLVMHQNAGQKWIESGISLEPGGTESLIDKDTNDALSDTSINEKIDACPGEGKGTSCDAPNQPQPSNAFHHIECYRGKQC